MSLEVSNRPIVGITMGDAAGIGPEIVLRALSDESVIAACRPIVIGDRAVLDRVASDLGLGVNVVPFDTESSTNGVEVLDLKNLPFEFAIGVDAAVTGTASAEYIEAAVKLWRDDKVDAICTAPISKKALAMGGHDYPGHTEFLAALTETSEFAMSFFADKLRVVLLSTHLPLVAAIDRIKKDRLIDLIRFSNGEFRRLLGRDVSIAVAGLNPHASEGGMFGSEEHDEIEPAIEYCRSELGIDVSGPYSPDTVFLRGFKGEFDVCVALYHDQATIAVKSLSFGSGVNVTLGLPFIRTSVDHGTAYDKAGKGTADASSMVAAIRLAGQLAAGWRKKVDIC